MSKTVIALQEPRYGGATIAVINGLGGTTRRLLDMEWWRGEGHRGYTKVPLAWIKLYLGFSIMRAKQRL